MDRIIEALEADISDRRGLKWEWQKIDSDVRAEIRTKWRSLFAKHLNAKEPPCTCSLGESDEMTMHAPLCMVSKAAEMTEWRSVAQEFVSLFDPAKPPVSPALFRAVMQGVKAANTSLRAGLPQEKVTKLRDELTMALSRLPDDDALTEFLDKAAPESETTDLDVVEAGMELQDSLAAARDALNVALLLLPPKET